jgi:hypothetical protein
LFESLLSEELGAAVGVGAATVKMVTVDSSVTVSGAAPSLALGEAEMDAEGAAEAEVAMEDEATELVTEGEDDAETTDEEGAGMPKENEDEEAVGTGTWVTENTSICRRPKDLARMDTGLGLTVAAAALFCRVLEATLVVAVSVISSQIQSSSPSVHSSSSSSEPVRPPEIPLASILTVASASVSQATVVPGASNKGEA